MKGPLGALPALSRSARWALAWCACLAALTAAATVVQAVALATALTGGSSWAVLAGAVVARAGLAWATESVAARAAAGAKEELRAALLDRSLALGPAWIAGRGPAELAVLATKGLDALDAYFTRYLPALVTTAVVPPLVGAWILVTDPTSAVLIALTIPLIPVFAILIGLFTQRQVTAAADTTERLSGHLLELVRALPVLTAFRRAEAQATAVRQIGDRHRRATMGTLRVAFLSALVLEIAASLSVALIAVGIGLRLVSGDLTLVTALVVLILAPECYLPLRAAGAAHHASEDGLEAVRRVNDVLTGAGGVPDVASAGADTTLTSAGAASAETTTAPTSANTAPTPTQPPPDPGGRPCSSVPPSPGREGVVDLACGQLQNLWTTHVRTGDTLLDVRDLHVHRREQDAPDGVSFTVRAGEVHRLDAPSGAGKSTTIAVLLGFVRPDAGEVLVCGNDLSTVDLSTWRRIVSWVPQRPAFAGATVVEELELVLGRRPERGELAEVAAEHLYDRRVNDLSTGERQRVAVARALLKVRAGARVLLLDEPTAHLDPPTAALVMAAVHRAAATGVAVVLATHRLAEAVDEPAPVNRIRTDHRDSATTRKPGRLLTGRALAGAALGIAALGSGVALSALAAYLIARAAEQPPILTLSVLVVGVRTFALAKGVLRYLERLVSHEAAFRLAGDLRVRLWEALVRLGPARLRRDTLQRLVDDTDTVRDLVPRVLLPPIVAAGVGAGAVLLFTLILPAAGLALAVALLVGGLAAPAVAVAVERRASTVLARGRRELGAEVFTLLDAAPDLISFGAHERKRADVAERDAELVRQARRQALGAGAATAVLQLTTGLASLVCTALALGHVDPLLVPVLGLVPLALAEALGGLPQAAQQRAALREAHQRLTEVIDSDDQAERGPDAPVRLRAADLGWPGAEPVLKDVDLDLPVGWTAVVGPSGAGKSTLFAALLGFLTPVQAPHRVAWCPQEPQLVATTVRENLRMADPHADDDRLRDALRLAGLPEWADRLDTAIGNGLLSGGEAQRVALARALLHDADLVLLDEPTAHLDPPTARALLDRLAVALRGRTVVHITHRPEETEGADLVLDVADGHVRERAYR
ncbi:thiol reductant ABC exporter subunit CydD [Umezawaea sp. Da 62-37]|uniref:thiol reductant ABC exporter subunit CydD n=1 Tax=Umezawaea sp. Da 62-37 TaxID=3075927 RepID=UPI0028F6D289|nr:thiol reductant ABC exporter subunit CydD [Umezawaea sp. Da 62-37]WNV91545.1 thiol reductant ABC exporter subunit CydD [Umezawaea sp. Da 62-37]